MDVDARIIRFLERHHVMTLATVHDGQPHCCTLFYAYDTARNRFVVTSSASTLHVKQVERNPRIAGAIALESKVIGKLQGIQLQGTMTRPHEESLLEARKTYLHRFPFAALMDIDLWIIDPDYLKLTDNRLGFGKKLLWKSSDPTLP